MIEVMIGLVIGMLAVLVIYQVYTVAEGFKRNTTAVGEAQQAGLFSTFVLGMQIGNAAAGMADAAQDLASCPDPGGAMPQRFAQSFRPIPVVITDGGGPAGNPSPDTFAVNYSMATTLANSAVVAVDLPAGTPNITVQSPGGFHNGDLIVAISPTAPGCASLVLTGPVLAPDTSGDVILPTPSGLAFALDSASRVLNMGPCSKVQKVQYSINNNILYSTPLLDPTQNCTPQALVPNPLASNIVNMKVEYGVADINDPKGVLSTWVQATAGNGWDPATVLTANVKTINLIKAIRIGLIVRSEQFDQTLGDYNWTLFGCSTPPCAGQINGTIPASVSPPGNWRYRTYETVIALRNQIWNKQ
jgi:type IV pilus assembly protein PilW